MNEDNSQYKAQRAQLLAHKIAVALFPPTPYCTDNAVRAKAEEAIKTVLLKDDAYAAGAAERDKEIERLQKDLDADDKDMTIIASELDLKSHTREDIVKEIRKLKVWINDHLFRQT